MMAVYFIPIAGNLYTAGGYCLSHYVSSLNYILICLIFSFSSLCDVVIQFGILKSDLLAATNCPRLLVTSEVLIYCYPGVWRISSSEHASASVYDLEYIKQV